MIYGANGYAGELIAREAKKRNLSPILAGRNEKAVSALAGEMGLEFQNFSLDDPSDIAKNLEQVHTILHCAGPFSATSAPMVSACLSTGTNYLDITGEIAVFESIHEQNEVAVNRGVTLMPGVGFDVVPTDCLALKLKNMLPDATSLTLAFTASGSPSRGTAKTMVEGFKYGGKIRKQGKIINVPFAYKVMEIPFMTGPKPAVTIPWGDVSTAYYTTGIPNIEVYMAATPKQINSMKILNFVRPFLGLGLVQNFMKSRINARPKGPSEAQRKSSESIIWGKVTNAAGQSREAHLRTPNGYDVTAYASVAIVEKVLSDTSPPGAKTPASVMGENFIGTLPAVEMKSEQDDSQ